jgi:hypothetical protein
MSNWKTLVHAVVTCVLAVVVAIMGLGGEPEPEQLQEIDDAQVCIDLLLSDDAQWGEVLENDACKAVLGNLVDSVETHYQGPE